MLIILEGPDLSGKTTLAERLVTYLGAKFSRSSVTLIHRGPPRSHPLNEYVTPLLDYRPDSGQHIICDRWHLGEMIYPAVMGRKTQMTPGVFQYIEWFLRSRGALIVKLVPPWNELEERYEVRGDRLLNWKQLKHAHKLWSGLRAGGVGWTFSTPTPDWVYDQAYSASRYTHRPPYFTTYVGPQLPDVLLVGDQRVCVGDGCKHWTYHDPLGPAFMPFPGTSGQFLLDALTHVDVGSSIGRYGLINACDVDDVAEFVHRFKTPRVIALGRQAERCLKKAEVNHAVVPHPQFVRRFHNHALVEYGRLINNTAIFGGDKSAWRPSQSLKPTTDKVRIRA